MAQELERGAGCNAGTDAGPEAGGTGHLRLRPRLRLRPQLSLRLRPRPRSRLCPPDEHCMQLANQRSLCKTMPRCTKPTC